jgi:APA family basic amino acid/polyamine antiporter
VAAGVVLLFTVLHAARRLHGFVWQNALVIAKLAFLVAFVVLGITFGSRQIPTWSPPGADDGFPFAELVVNQFWIAFAFSGWNAAIYLAREFRQPKRDVGRAMVVGLLCVSLLYLLINWVFVANLTPAEAQAVFAYEQSRITLGHLVAAELFGDVGGMVMSIFVIVAFMSAISAMMIVGPRVYAAMAADGFLPKVFAGGAGSPPAASVILQGSVVMILLFSQTLRESLQAASAFLMLFTALTALSLFRLARLRAGARRPGTLRLAAAVVHAGAVMIILSVGLKTSPALWVSLTTVLALATIGFIVARRRAATSASPSSPAP